MSEKKKQFIDELVRIGAFKLGEFTLKSGTNSPYYLDLRLLISHPSLLRMASELLWEKISSLSFDLICGVPYAALPLATCVSVFYDKPMILRRKTPKGYGTKKIIEGDFQPNQKCIVIEDVISSGISALETTEILTDHNLAVSDIVVLVDRMQGGKQALANHRISLHSVLSIREITMYLSEKKAFDKEQINDVFAYLYQHET